jgi:hypothetical protein
MSSYFFIAPLTLAACPVGEELDVDESDSNMLLIMAIQHSRVERGSQADRLRAPDASSVIDLSHAASRIATFKITNGSSPIAK